MGEPVLRRSITFTVHERTVAGQQDCLEVVAEMRDERPWAGTSEQPRTLHHMELRCSVRLADMVIVEAEAAMHQFPHTECPAIAPAFAGLVGLSIARGFTRQVQRQFGGVSGCTHLELLARTMGPAVVQAAASARARHRSGDDRGHRVDDGAGATADGESAGREWMRNSCHIWADGGVGEQKLRIGWRPGRGPFPAPPLAQLHHSRPGGPGD